jgi:hypothetical protein
VESGTPENWQRKNTGSVREISGGAKMKTEIDIKNAESTGHYHFPFLPGVKKNALLDDSFKKDDFVKTEMYSKNGYKYSDLEKADLFLMICVQRIVFEAALAVFRKEFVAINPALKHYGYYKIVGENNG